MQCRPALLRVDLVEEALDPVAPSMEQTAEARLPLATVHEWGVWGGSRILSPCAASPRHRP